MKRASTSIVPRQARVIAPTKSRTPNSRVRQIRGNLEPGIPAGISTPIYKRFSDGPVNIYIRPLGNSTTGIATVNRIYCKMISELPGYRLVNSISDSDMLISFDLHASRRNARGQIQLVTYFWDSSLLPSRYAQNLSTFNAVLVASESTREVLQNSGVKSPIYVVPIPIQHSENAQGRLRVNIPSSSVVYYSIGAISGGPGLRKNLQKTIDCFEDFARTKPAGSVVLIIKSDSSARLVSRSPSVIISTNNWPADEILTLRDRADVYISVSGGESYSLPTIEAASLQKSSILSTIDVYKEYIDNAYWIPTREVLATNLVPGKTYPGTLRDFDRSSLIKALESTYRDIKQGALKSTSLKVDVSWEKSIQRLSSTLDSIIRH